MEWNEKDSRNLHSIKSALWYIFWAILMVGLLMVQVLANKQFYR